jgi:hypothetical protein
VTAEDLAKNLDPKPTKKAAADSKQETGKAGAKE